MTNSADNPNPKLHLGLLIHLANQFKDQLLSHYFSPADITAAQFKVLISIYKGFTSPVEVSKNLLMDAGAMSRMLERMVKRDLVVRTTNPDDKRQVILGLTAKGRAICDRFQNEALASILTSLTERLNEDEAQQLVTLLIKMLPDGATQPYR